MTKQRALEIRQSIMDSGGWKDCATPEEREEIRKVWRNLPGHFSFYDAVTHIIVREMDKEQA